MCTEELRQNVFSSIHMSTLAKSIQASITYPSCTFCGGMLIGSSSKSSPKRKSVLCQLTLYTNSSESFVVWWKKPEEPKGILWLRSCCVRKGGQENTLELISRGCRGRCSYTLRFTSSRACEEWYRLLKQESRKIPLVDDEVPSSLNAEEDSYLASLDSMLTDTSPLNVLNEVLHGSSEEEEESLGQVTSLSTTTSSQSSSAPTTKSPKTKTPKTKSVKSKLKKKSAPVICNPLQGLSSKSNKKAMSTSLSSGTVAVVGSVPLDSIENITPPTSTDLSRWSWPMKVQ